MENTAFTKALPVWAEGLEDEMNVTIVFETAFVFAAAQGARLRLAGAQAYRITVNGAFAGYGPARAPKGFARVDEWDLSPFCRKGANALAIEVVSYRCYNYYLPNVPGFLRAELLIGRDVAAATPDGFTARLAPRVQKVARYSYQRPFGEVWRLPASAARADRPLRLVASAYGASCTLLPRRVGIPDFSVSKPFSPKLEVDHALAADPVERSPWWMEKDTGDHFRFDPEELEENLALETRRLAWTSSRPAAPRDAYRLEAGRGVLFDGGSIHTGFIKARFRVEVAPARVLAVFDEVVDDKGLLSMSRYGCVNAVVWEFAETGDYAVESFEPYTFRHLQLLSTEGTLLAAPPQVRAYACADATKAPPALGDADLAAIFEAARETFAQNAVDVFTDCPGRERAGWLCDSFWTARTSWYLTGSNALETLFIENFAVPEAFEWIPAGMLPMCWPADHPTGGFIPNWALWFVIELEEYARLRDGDPALVARLRPRVLALLDYLRSFANADGLLENLPSWVFVEWSQANALTKGVNYPSNATWAGTLDAVARLYGLPELAAEAARVRETIRRQSFDGEWFHDQALRGEDGTLSLVPDRTETCQYYAFYFHVATPGSHAALWRRLVEEFGPDRQKAGRYPDIWPSNAFIGNYLRLELLARAGLGGKIRDETLGYFKYMADRTGTLWENVSTVASCCHGFASHVAVLLARDVAREGNPRLAPPDI